MQPAGRFVISIGSIWTILLACLRLPHVDHATVALLMVLTIIGLARIWGRLEASAGAIAGGVGLDYYYLPPSGFGVTSVEHWVAMVTFLVASLAAGQVAAQLK